MVTKGLLVRLHPKAGQEPAVEELLKQVMPTIQAEHGTTTLFMVRLSPTEYGIFNAFPDEQSRQEHMNGNAAATLFASAELFAEAPIVEPVEILAAKLPA